MNEKYSSACEILNRGSDFNEKEIPSRIQSFSTSLVHPDNGAWVHFYEEDGTCKAYTEGIIPYVEHFRNFAGVVTLDRSIGWCDSLDVQRDADRVNKFSQKVFKENGIPYIVNVRFGDKKSYSFCFREIPQHAILFVGSRGTQVYADGKAVFWAGTETIIKFLHPRTLLVYGCMDGRILKRCEERGISLIRYPSRCELAHAKFPVPPE